MKILAGIVLSVLLCLTGQAQTSVVDSLKRALAATREDTAKVLLLAKLCYYGQNNDTCIACAQQGLLLARQINYRHGEAICHNQFGNRYNSIGDFPKALEHYLESLKIHEATHNLTGMATAYGNISDIYYEQADYATALEYLYKNAAIDKLTGDGMAITSRQFGVVFEAMNRLDSALHYYQLSYAAFNSLSSKYQMAMTLKGLGSIHGKMGHVRLANEFFYMAEQSAQAFNDSFALANIYLGMGELFARNKAKDSALLYATRAMTTAQLAKVRRVVINAGKLLSALYEERQDARLALFYYKIAASAQDSIYSNEKTTSIKRQSVDEDKRQEGLEAAREQRIHNLWYAVLAVGLICVLILFLLLSRTIIVNERAIKFLGITALLLVFEFINLLLHPLLEHITHGSPPLMLLIMVGIAALLVPTHHWLEKWSTRKLIEKNNAIRLRAAKRVIAKLEPGEGQ